LVQDHLPQTLIHGDLALVNTVKGPNGAFTLIDWDGGGLGVRLFEVAYLLFQWLSDDLTFDLASAQAFFRAYLARQPLEDQEFAYLLDMSLLLPLNFILFGNPAQKWQKISWLHQHRAEIMRQLTALRL
jgi:Ser/Thr protein kinase RdoA (MazF antagonist)